MTSTAEFVNEQEGGSYLATFMFAENLLINCPTFYNTICNFTDPEEARDKVHHQESLAEADVQTAGEYEGDESPELEERPLAIILDDTRTNTKVGVNDFMGEGTVIVAIEALVPNDLKIDRQTDNNEVIKEKFHLRRRWRAKIAGLIEDEILERSGGHDDQGNPFLNVVDTDLIIPPADADSDQSVDHIGFAIALSWK